MEENEIEGILDEIKKSAINATVCKNISGSYFRGILYGIVHLAKILEIPWGGILSKLQDTEMDITDIGRLQSVYDNNTFGHIVTNFDVVFHSYKI